MDIRVAACRTERSVVEMKPTCLLAGAAAGAAATILRHILVTRRSIASVAPELRSIGLYFNYSFARPWMLPLGRRLLDRPTAVPEGASVRTVSLPSEDGSFDVFIYEPLRRERRTGALLWIHGGGHILGTAAGDHSWCTEIAEDLGVPVISVDYRIGAFPLDLDDCFTALKWLHDSANSLNIDDSRIAIGGGSAGGGLAVALAQRAFDQGIPVSFQMLEYPMLDDRTGLRPDPAGRGRFAWTPTLNRMAWRVYLGHKPGLLESRPYAVPARRQNLSGLPPAWIGVGSLDLFHDENLEYARRLNSAGVSCEVHVEDGMYHGADAAMVTAITSGFRSRMIESLRPHVS
ncbi:acetyl esterase/lipase [Microbacterium sp. W4I4]|uniref:alpha/beta hydrolase n=1 Tax=Microbacterium sp. W4I4 TaxID=3042295 RepID=UPI002785DACF|nr:alpha/beta hydrolase [Microbacterium sp. W4I4]MDQ0613989.1 acetyl esterase/lipase [Microbacterium sp. W4I4]